MQTIRRLFLPTAVLLLSALTPAFGEEPLPRVLILGDSVYREPARSVASELKGRFEVVHAALQPGEVLNTESALKNLDAWLGEGEWDLIHFNFGLGDLVHRAPNMKAFRVMAREAGGVRATSPQQYEKNLHALVARLQRTGAKLVWANTTPIRHSSTNVFEMGSEVT
ncbi:MAG: SGNH/GDSL hydrolase family protein, partial [Planctomycetales bacterium]